MKILVDMDGIVVDLLTKWLKDCHEEAKKIHDGSLVTAESIFTFNIHEHVPIGHACYDIIKRPNYFDDLPPHDGAIDALKAIERMGHEVTICSSPAGPDSARAKLEWVERHLGWNRRKVILCHHKWQVRADAIIDDKPSTLLQCKEQGMRTATIGYPYNEVVFGHVNCYADGYQDMAGAWKTLTEWARAQS